MANDVDEIERIIGNSELSLAEMISEFRDLLMKESIVILRMSAGSQEIEAQQEKFDKMQKAFNGLEKMYYSKMKMDKMTGNKRGASDKSFMDSIRKKQDSIGDIIRENG